MLPVMHEKNKTTINVLQTEKQWYMEIKCKTGKEFSLGFYVSVEQRKTTFEIWHECN